MYVCCPTTLANSSAAKSTITPGGVTWYAEGGLNGHSFSEAILLWMKEAKH